MCGIHVLLIGKGSGLAALTGGMPVMASGMPVTASGLPVMALQLRLHQATYQKISSTC